jgi:hypothetical protein
MGCPYPIQKELVLVADVIVALPEEGDVLAEGSAPRRTAKKKAPPKRTPRGGAKKKTPPKRAKAGGRKKKAAKKAKKSARR